jgi:hypothetical protein
MARVAIDLGTAVERPEVPVTPSPDLVDWVDFAEAGSDATGEFRCADCGYGVVVQHVLPPCPMCRGAIWERRQSRFAV